MNHGIKGLAAVAAAVLLAVFGTLALLPATGSASPAAYSPAPANPTAKATPANLRQKLKSSAISNQIVGGSETTFQAHPWLVQITLDGQHWCGGALVHPMIVFTAAHCLWDEQNNKWYNQEATMQAFTSRTQSLTGGEELNLHGTGMSADYQPLSQSSSGGNDWGFIALSSPSSRPTLKIAGPDERSLWRAGKNAVAAGYGLISEGGMGSAVLKHVSVPIIADSVCNQPNVYGSAFNAGTMLCAGSLAGGQSTCQGDSGGPLTVGADGGVRRIVGAVSWADGCARPNRPTIYARVAEAAVSNQINARAVWLGQQANFPGIYADTNIIGSGAKPEGCGAAQSAAARAGAALKKAKKANTAAAKKVKKAKKAVKKAKGRRKAKAKKALKKAQKSQKKAKQALAKATRKAKSANATASARCN